MLRIEFTEDGYTAEQIRLLEDKGVYPYEYTKSFESLQKTELPAKEAFYSKLTESDISNTEYQRALNVWREFNM